MLCRSTRARWWLAASWAALAACDADRPREPGPTAAPPPAPARPADDSSFRHAAADRLVAIGDLHGDLAAARAALRLAGAIDEGDQWVGGKLVVVQTGDQLDRGDDEPELLKLFDRLRDDAKKTGGAVHSLNGNHEVMNVNVDFRYVTPDGFRDFAQTGLVGMRGRKAALLPTEQQGRASAFLPGGPEAKRLAERPVAIVVGDTVFAHGGVLPGHVRYGLGRLNQETRAWMLGETARLPEAMEGDGSPIWTREYSDGQPAERACEALSRVLDQLGAKRMVVGHTVQKDGISSGCGDKVWRVDVGLSRHYSGKPSVLEVRGAEVKVLQGEAARPVDAGVDAAPRGSDAGVDGGKRASAHR